MSNYNKVNRVLIGDGTGSGATSFPGIQKGDLLLLDKTGNVVPTNADATALSKFDFVQVAAGIGNGQAILSSPIYGNTVSEYLGSNYAAPAQKRVILGYNGTAGTGIDVDVSTEYRLRVNILDDHRTNGMRQTFGDYNFNGSASSTAEDCVKTILCLADQEDYDENAMKDYVMIEGVSDGAGSAIADASVVKGSTTVVITGHGLTVGGWVRLGGTTDEFPVYPVKEVIDANTIVLGVSYKGETDAALPAAAVATATEWGFMITGIEQEALLSRTPNEPWGRYEWVNFNGYFNEASDRDFSSAATSTTVQFLNPGNGYWKQVAYEEEQAKGYLGDTSKRRFDDKRIASVVVVDEEYDSINIIHADIHRGDFQDTYNAPLKTTVYIPNGSDQGLNSGDNFVHILNGFFSDVVGFGEVIFS